MTADPYTRLLELCRRERELVAPERFGELTEVQSERIALMEALPEHAPPEAREAIEEARFLVLETIGELSFALDNLRADLVHLGRGRTALASYGPAGGRSSLEAKG